MQAFSFIPHFFYTTGKSPSRWVCILIPKVVRILPNEQNSKIPFLGLCFPDLT